MNNSFTHITRRPGSLRIEGLYASSLESLRQELAARGAAPTTWVVADLTLGAWRGYQIATDFYAQLGLAMPRRLQDNAATNLSLSSGPPDATSALSYADTIGTLIDAESGGDKILQTAYDLALRLLERVRQEPLARTFLVFLPRYGFACGRDNTEFLRFWLQGLSQTGSRLILIGVEQAGAILPPDWQVDWLNRPLSPLPATEISLPALIPGVISPDLGDLVQAMDHGSTHCSQLEVNGQWIIAPECRCDPHTVPKAYFDRLARLLQYRSGWLEAYALLFAHDPLSNPRLLFTEAWNRFLEGGHEIAFRLLDAITAHTRHPLLQGYAQAQQQGMRIALQHFEAAAQAPDPDTTLDLPLRAFLLQSKGWGLAMIGQPLHAKPYLHEARTLLAANENRREYLYLLNITALNKVKLGDRDAAFALENTIDARLAAQPRRDWHLEYINSLNLARLYRMQGDFEAAEQRYHRAFSTIQGLHSESDSVYINVCWAKLRQAQSQPKAALDYWLRAALHWVAASLPEALAPRVATAIVERSVKSGDAVAEEVSSALIAQLYATAVAAQLDAVEEVFAEQNLEPKIVPTFLRSEMLNDKAGNPSATFDCAFGASGWSVLSLSSHLPPPFEGSEHRRLRSLLMRLLSAPAPAIKARKPTCVVVDDRLGREMALSEVELLETCVRLGVPRMIYDNRVIVLDDQLRTHLTRSGTVGLAEAVDAVATEQDTTWVTFKRYRKAMPLSPQQSQIVCLIVDALGATMTVSAIDKALAIQHLIPQLRILEQARIIDMKLSSG